MNIFSKLIIVAFMAIFVIPMLAIGGLLDLFEVPLRKEQSDVDDIQAT